MENFTSDEETVTARFKSGLEVTSDLLIAADGIRSGTRSLVLPDLKPEYAGYVACHVPKLDVASQLTWTP